MELAPIVRALWNRKLLTAVVVVVAIAGAAGAKFSQHPTQAGSASLQLIVDSPVSAIADLRQNPVPLATRAAVLAQLMTSTKLQDQIAQIARVPVSEISAVGPFSTAGQASQGASATGSSPPSGGGSAATGKTLYQLSFATQDQQPLITVTAQAPTPAVAGRLANAVYPAASGYLHTLQVDAQPQPSPKSGATSGAVPPQHRVTIRELGPAQVGVVSSGSALVLAAGAFIGLLVIGLSIVLRSESARQKRRAPKLGEQSLTPDVGQAKLPQEWDRSTFVTSGGLGG
jgi:capsular polysaccharide biosynthesis protein